MNSIVSVFALAASIQLQPLADQPGPSPMQSTDANQIALCWAAVTNTYLLMISRADPPPPARHSVEQQTLEAMGYYNGLMAGAFPTDEQLSTAIRTGMAAFERSDQRQTTIDCVRSYGMQIQRLAPLVSGQL